MRVLFAVVEMSPLAKVGGLADVAGSLPKALVQHGHDVRVMLPLHAGIDTAAYGFRRILADVPVQTPRGPEQVAVWQGTVHGVTTYLVEAAELFERPHIYGEPDNHALSVLHALVTLYENEGRTERAGELRAQIEQAEVDREEFWSDVPEGEQ